MAVDTTYLVGAFAVEDLEGSFVEESLLVKKNVALARRAKSADFKFIKRLVVVNNEERSSIVESGSRLVKFVPKLERALNVSGRSEFLRWTAYFHVFLMFTKSTTF